MDLDDLDTVDELPDRPRYSIPEADRELLEHAARALGAVQVEDVDGEEWLILHFADGSVRHAWNPLIHSDDAFHLIVALQLTLEMLHDRAIAKTYFITDGLLKFITIEELTADDPARAARYAATRAAGELAKRA
jgi:hypothetical protein